jgi:hypothetical protein
VPPIEGTSGDSQGRQGGHLVYTNVAGTEDVPLGTLRTSRFVPKAVVARLITSAGEAATGWRGVMDNLARGREETDAEPRATPDRRST